ncbi:prepilin-type N-terminal cleavage/methylation domain-containing protein [Parelusimicrobium proximum]|uniref:type IV pilin protein n=1 Tax=Parelusimicrobium proximum TaxID=3228953 RepID=UPI003D1631E1
MKKGFYNNHVGAESFSAHADDVYSTDRAEKDSAPTIRKRSSRRDDLNKSSLLRTPQSSLPLNCYGIRGFTLIELLVVVLIIAILAAVALPQYTAAVEKSRFTEALLNARALSESVRRYILANDSAPTSFDELDISLPNLTKVSASEYYNNNFIYRIGSSSHNVLVVDRKLSSSNNNNSQAPAGIGYWYGQDSRDAALADGTLACFVRTTASEANQKKYTQVCLSLGGKTPALAASDALHYILN